MTAPVRQYTDEIHRAFSYWATWLPNASIAVGDCGPIDDRVFNPEAALGDFDVRFDLKRGTKPLNMEYASRGAVSYSLQLSAGNQKIPDIPQGKAGIEITFGRENAVVLVIREGYQHRIRNIAAVRRDLFNRADSGDFPRTYAVVTHVVLARSATVLISSASNSRYAASANADLTGGLLDLANADLSFSRVAGTQLETEFVAAEGLTPMFKLVGFKKKGWFWGSSRLVDLGFQDDEDPGDVGEVIPSDTDPQE